MKALAMNFAWQPRTATRTGGIVLCVVAVALILACAAQYVRLNRQMERWQSDWQRLQQSESSAKVLVSEETQEHLKGELRYASRVIDKLDLPWDSLFAAVESAFNQQATLLAIEPDAETRQVRLTAEAKDFPAMLDYLKQLQQSPALRDAYLSSHQINQQDSQRPVRFVINARWVDAPMPSASVKPAQIVAAVAPTQP